MTGKTIALIGGPETGKTNFLARLWTSLKKGEGSLSAPSIPEDIVYVEDAVEYLLAGEFAPRTREKGISGTLEIQIDGDHGIGVSSSILTVPDVMGEEWDKIIHDREAAPEIHKVLNEVDGALLFVRALSELNDSPLDWVTAQKFLALPIEKKESTGKLPTQVALCELLSILEFTSSPESKKRKVAVIVTAWDRLDAEKASNSPMKFLKDEFPMFAGKILDSASLEVMVYGFSVVGGDLDSDSDFKESFLDTELCNTGYVVQETGGAVEKNTDVTLPMRWLLTN